MRGQVWRFGDNVTTDDIIAGKYKHVSLEPAELSRHFMENLRPDLADRIRPGDFVVAGANFGCGSSREQAPIVMRHLGIAAVVAPSFARIFFRNALNIGLLAVVAPTADIEEGDELEYLPQTGALTVAARSLEVRSRPLPPECMEIAAAGGLLPYVRQRGGL